MPAAEAYSRRLETQALCMPQVFGTVRAQRPSKEIVAMPSQQKKTFFRRDALKEQASRKIKEKPEKKNCRKIAVQNQNCMY